ncbi:MAG: L-threonylcarbamoyladenylate synthase [Pseudomonadota bacterium]|nr:L-threonylcarbamoyladenylate synthase [Pseudomonadota bacterium]
MTHIFSADSDTIARAAKIIKSGGLVAFPTETVYGLGASAYDARAVAHIFEAKNRPTFNPLISHIAHTDFLGGYAVVDERVLALAKRFWPGPLTFVLKRKDMSPALDLACAGLPTVTVRMPNHPIALNLIEASGVPIVAPSANRSQSISPTTAKHVWESLGERVDMILDGGPCAVGVESTIIDLTGPQVIMLRPGGLAKEDIEDFLGEPVILSAGNPDLPSSPGQMLKHYAPAHPLRINVTVPDFDEFFIGFGDVGKDAPLNLSLSGDLCEAASHLFDYMHRADEQTAFSKIAIAPIPNKGLGLAINDRIRRASYKK